ncbi:hypothetical protein TIFTF001_009244 [Ficus carica]|uniref:tryptophan--tRNA ligase n=1 Tax=Ficus carica TaxID=3494 RepID=A0AA88CYS3_FICCA|nr:hypothetical protein TIFTF001_009244 [Ficus carica]
MGRSVFSHFLNLSTSSPRLASSLYSLSPPSLSLFSASSSILSRRTFSETQKMSDVFDADSRLGRSMDIEASTSKELSRFLSAGFSADVIAPRFDAFAVFRCLSPPLTKLPRAPKRIVSGVQPTGSIHLGNYLGAIKNWISLQNTYDTLFFIVDLHAITLPYDAKTLSKATRDTAAIYLACGVDPSKASVFVQSHVRAHVELMWLLSSATPVGWLNKMIQFKEKSRKTGDENVGVALLTYPVLMASDILLYQSDFVPVGEDQKQHLELTRELAERVNYLYGGRKWKKLGGRGGAIFKVPEPLIPPAGARVMSLVDGLSKMSKSAPSDQSRINLLDPKDNHHHARWVSSILSFDIAVLSTGMKVIAYKIKRCKTDSFPSLEFDNPERPECNNLLSIYQLVSGRTKEEVAQECQGLNWGTFKSVLTDALIDHLHPIQFSLIAPSPDIAYSSSEINLFYSRKQFFVRYDEIISDVAYLDRILAEGAAKASEIADSTLNNVYQAMGFLRR